MLFKKGKCLWSPSNKHWIHQSEIYLKCQMSLTKIYTENSFLNSVGLLLWLQRKKNTLKNVLAFLECKVQVKPRMATMGLRWIMNYFWLGCLTCSKIFSPNSAIKQNISLSENKWEAWVDRNVLSLCFTLWPRHQPEAGHRKNSFRQRQGKSAKKMTKCWRKHIIELF